MFSKSFEKKLEKILEKGSRTLDKWERLADVELARRHILETTAITERKLSKDEEWLLNQLKKKISTKDIADGWWKRVCEPLLKIDTEADLRWPFSFSFGEQLKEDNLENRLAEAETYFNIIKREYNEKLSKKGYNEKIELLFKAALAKGWQDVSSAQVKQLAMENNMPLRGELQLLVTGLSDKLHQHFQKIPKASRRPLPKAIRSIVFSRDNHRCIKCGRGPPEVKLHIDHKIPVSRGGTDYPENLQTLCDECNLNKSDAIV